MASKSSISKMNGQWETIRDKKSVGLASESNYRLIRKPSTWSVRVVCRVRELNLQYCAVDLNADSDISINEVVQ